MNFDQEVLRRSKEIPVVVDFWAPWCGPCQFLGPVIEELAKESNGKWELVKVNTDENPQISTSFGIKGIPAVKMFSKGEVIAEFTGALPKPQIEKWIEQYLPDERKDVLVDIQEKLNRGDKGSLQDLKDFVGANPDLKEAKILLAKALAFEDTETAYAMVSNLKPGEPNYDVAVNIKTIQKILTCEIPDDGEASQKLKEVKSLLSEKDIEGTISLLIDIVMINRTFCDDLPRLGAIAIFNLLGSDNEITRKYRRKFDMALY